MMLTDWNADANKFTLLQSGSDGINSVAKRNAYAHGKDNPNHEEPVQE